MASLLVSIITPSYNQGKFIEQTLLSVKHQTYPYVEHIVIDGGSTDNTLAILQSYEKTYNLHWFSEPDRGMYDAINKGLRKARGDILAYLNSDDFYLPWTVETIVEYFLKYPKVDLVFGDELAIDAQGRILLQFQPPLRLALLRRTGWSLPQPTVFWRRRVYETLGGFDESLQFCGDWDYWMRASARFQIGQIREFLAVVQIHERQKTVAQRGELIRELETLLLRYAAPSERGYWRKMMEKIYAWLWQRILMGQFLLLYFGQKGRKDSRCAEGFWKKLMSVQGLKLGPWKEIVGGFLPFGHRNKYKWSLLGTLKWEQTGFVYENSSQDHF